MDNFQTNNKISFHEIAFLAGSVLCITASIVFLLRVEFLFSLIFISLQGFLTIVHLVICHTQRVKQYIPGPAVQDMLHGSPYELVNYDNAQITKLRQENDELSYNNELLTTQLTELTKKNQELVQLLAEAQLKKVESLDPDVASSILPPAEKVSEFDLIASANQIINQMQPLCAKAGIRLELSTSSTSLFFKADERYISLMLKNIIDNSIKYMQQNGNLVITISNTGSSLFIAFKDNGRGLPEDEMPNIFDLNFQGSNRISGNGLGLAQVKAIVEHYQGNIYAHSSNGMGIYIQLPIDA